LFSPHHPKIVIATEGGALCRRSGEICCCFAIVVVCSSRPVTHKPVISTEGGASAAAAEKSAVAVAVACTPDTTQEASFRPKAAYLPPQWRNLLLSLPLFNLSSQATDTVPPPPPTATTNPPKSDFPARSRPPSSPVATA